jgi:hypothetical protein
MKVIIKVHKTVAEPQTSEPALKKACIENPQRKPKLNNTPFKLLQTVQLSLNKAFQYLAIDKYITEKKSNSSLE